MEEHAAAAKTNRHLHLQVIALGLGEDVDAEPLARKRLGRHQQKEKSGELNNGASLRFPQQKTGNRQRG